MLLTGREFVEISENLAIQSCDSPCGLGVDTELTFTHTHTHRERERERERERTGEGEKGLYTLDLLIHDRLKPH